MENNQVAEKSIVNISTELIIIGSIYKDPSICITYCPHIRSKYDFYGEDTKFFYDMAELMYQTYSQTFDESKINAFMMQDDDRMKTYRKCGGYKYISNALKLSDVDDFLKHYETLKKYSLLREYEKKGFDVQKIMTHRNFAEFDCSIVVNMIRAKMDKISTVILSNRGSNILTDNAEEKLTNFLITPQMGILSPWENINKCFRGLQLGKTLMLGFLSNEGKSRNLMLLMAHLALLNDEKVLIMSNEMSEDSLFTCLLVTCINNPQFQALHGVNINKPEEEVVLGIYRDKYGDIISRFTDDDGDYIEDEDIYISRVKEQSEEFKQVLQVTKWLQDKKDKLIYFKDVGDDYSDKTIEFEIRKHKTLYDIKYVGYDTLKGYKADDWMLLKQSATNIQELGKEIGVFIWAVFQLTDDAYYVDVFDLSSNNIANAKQIYHVADMLIVGKKIVEEDYHKYTYTQHDDDYGETIDNVPLKKGKSYFAMKVAKNRLGKKPVILFEYNLDYNTWIEIGILHRTFVKPKTSKK